jgi:hypothetical protein
MEVLCALNKLMLHSLNEERDENSLIGWNELNLFTLFPITESLGNRAIKLSLRPALEVNLH